MNTEYSISVSSAIVVQCRVIVALILREIHTFYGSSRLGYLWAIFESMLGIAIFWAIRSVAGAQSPNGMPMIIFLLSGFGVWYLFSNTLSKCLAAVSGNDALLTFPQVTPWDLMVARTIVVWGTQLLSGILIVCIASMLGQSFTMADFGGFLACIFLAPLFGLGLGAVFASLTYFWKPIEKIIPIFTRILFFTSGIFFSVSIFPQHIQEILLLNPLMHLIEWMRQSLSGTFLFPVYDVQYVVSCTLVALCLGMLLERYVRGRMEI